VRGFRVTRSRSRLGREASRLWLLSSMQDLAREQRLGPVSFAQIVDATTPSTPRADSPPENRWTLYLATLDEAVGLATSRVIAACEAGTTVGRIARMRATMEESMEAYDELRRVTNVYSAQLLPAAPPIALTLWELPPGGAGRPHRHRLGQTQLILVLEGRPTLHTREARRELQEGEALVLAGEKDVSHELVNGTREKVRFLALGTSDQVSLVI
jgi:quercetin dioxygenase-like cupin family protein